MGLTIQGEWDVRHTMNLVHSLVPSGLPSMIRSRAALASLVFISAVLLNACRENEQAGHAGAFWSGSEPVEVASGHAIRGPWRQNESDFDYVDDPAVAISDDGHVGVAWIDQARKDLFFQMYTPAAKARFPEPINVSSSPGTFSWLPRLAFAPGEPRRVYALWQEIVFSGGNHGGEIFFARSRNGGATFDSPINLSNSVAGDGKGLLTADRWDNGSLDLAIGPDGRIYAAWTEYEGRLWVSRSTDAGATFNKAVHVAGDASRPARAPALVADRSGSVHLAWSAGGQAPGKIHVSASRDGQSFAAPQIMPSSGHADAPDIAADSQGRLHIVFAESPDGLLGQYRIRYTQRDSGGGQFAEPKTIAGPDPGVSSVNFPNLAVDAAGRLYIVWKRFPHSRQHPHGLGFTMSPDGGHRFAKPEIVPESDNPGLGFSGGLQGSLMARLAVNASGALALADSTFAPGGSSHIWLWRKPAAAR